MFQFGKVIGWYSYILKCIYTSDIILKVLKFNYVLSISTGQTTNLLNYNLYVDLKKII